MILGDKKVAPLSLRNYIFRAPALWLLACVSKGESPAMSVCGFARKTALVAKRSISELCICTTHIRKVPRKLMWHLQEETSQKRHIKSFCFGARRGVSSIASPFIFIEYWISSSRLISRRTTFCPQVAGFPPILKYMIYIHLFSFLHLFSAKKK